jgi:uncharacterized membrane protein HdeD (DUF308 family)
VLAFAWPHLTLTTLVVLFGCFALIYGLVSLTAAITNRRPGRNRWLVLAEGVVGICAGILALRTPSTTAKLFIFFIVPWAIVTGILRIAEAIRLRKEITGEVWLVLSGAVTILLGVVLARRTIASVVELAWIVAGYALLLGLFEVLLGFELRTVGHARQAG